MNKKEAGQIVASCLSSSLVCSIISLLLIISIVIIYIFTKDNNNSSNNYNQNYCIVGGDTNGYNIQNTNGVTIPQLGDVSCSNNHLGTASVICNPQESNYFQFSGCYCYACPEETGNPCIYYEQDEDCNCILMNKQRGEPCDDNNAHTDNEECDGNGVCLGRCPEDHYKTYQGCIQCPIGQHRNYSMTDSYCQDIICEIDQEVDFLHTASGRTDNLVCKDCAPGKTTNGQKYRVKYGKQECINIECGEDQYVSLDHECEPCPPGTVNIAGDDATGAATECDPILCLVNQHVVGNQCVDCPSGTVNIAGDNASGGDTNCVPMVCEYPQNITMNIDASEGASEFSGSYNKTEFLCNDSPVYKKNNTEKYLYYRVNALHGDSVGVPARHQVSRNEWVFKDLETAPGNPPWNDTDGSDSSHCGSMGNIYTDTCFGELNDITTLENCTWYLINYDPQQDESTESQILNYSSKGDTYSVTVGDEEYRTYCMGITR